MDRRATRRAWHWTATAVVAMGLLGISAQTGAGGEPSNDKCCICDCPGGPVCEQVSSETDCKTVCIGLFNDSVG